MSIEVVNVAGWARSGSTILCQIIGAFDDTVSVGELSQIWRAMAHDETCACGEPLSGCSLWRPVMAELAEGNPGLDPAEVQEVAYRVLRTKDSFALARLDRDDPTSWPQDVRTYVEHMARLYRAISRHSGATRIVDSSKRPPSWLTQRLDTGLTTSVVHLTRDPRAVANSELKTLRVTGPSVDLPPGQTAFKSALSWAAFNAAVAATRGRADRWTQVTYESLGADFDGEVDRIARFLGATRGAELMDVGHIAVGNPGRRRGDARFTADLSWQQDLGRKDQFVASAVTAPVRAYLARRRPGNTA